jgi:hypothetical protein
LTLNPDWARRYAAAVDGGACRVWKVLAALVPFGIPGIDLTGVFGDYWLNRAHLFFEAT